MWLNFKTTLCDQKSSSPAYTLVHNVQPRTGSETCGPVLEAPCGGGAGLGQDRPLADPGPSSGARAWLVDSWSLEMRGSLAMGPGIPGTLGLGRRPETRGSQARKPVALALEEFTRKAQPHIGTQAGVLTAREPPASQHGIDGL